MEKFNALGYKKVPLHIIGGEANLSEVNGFNNIVGRIIGQNKQKTAPTKHTLVVMNENVCVYQMK